MDDDADTFGILKWSEVWKTEGLELTENGTCIGAQSQQLKDYKYALGDTVPVKSGKTCWRFQIKNPNRYWYSLAIATPKEYPNQGTSKHGVYGVGTDPNWYPSGHDEHSGSWAYPSRDITDGIYHVDMAFDADIGEIQLCVLEDKSINAKVWNVASEAAGSGYVPHFNTINVEDCEIRIANIHVDSFGKEVSDIFVS